MSEILGDPRSITIPVYQALQKLRQSYNEAKKNKEIGEDDYNKRLREQKTQAQELYTYLATWGLMRLRAEEMSRNAWERSPEEIPLAERAKKNQEGKREMLECFFKTLEEVSTERNIASFDGVKTLSAMNYDNYIGLTGIALAVAREFSFWADAIYTDIQGGDAE
ncbi:MAG: hypothetical protein AB4426_05520 [Xenococcaceae cyanobacterium]